MDDPASPGLPSAYRVPAGVQFPDRQEWPVTLRAGAVVLRPLRLADRRAWRRLRERNAEWLAPWEPTSPPDCEPLPTSYWQLLRAQHRQARQGLALPWGIGWDPELRHGSGDAPLVGQLSLSGVMLGPARHASVGYWIDEQHAGHQIVPTALALACDYAFAVMRLHRIEVCMLPDNSRSRRVAEKLGFRAEGRRPQYLHIAGQWRDHDVFALHEDEVGGGLLVRLQRLGWRAGAEI